jgi:hypothetical protein
MQDPRDGQVRYLIHFSDGGSGTRWRDEPLEPGPNYATALASTRSSAPSSRRTRTASGMPPAGPAGYSRRFAAAARAAAGAAASRARQGPVPAALWGSQMTAGGQQTSEIGFAQPRGIEAREAC